MPRVVRNFWIELEVDGKKTKVATGPRSKDGGFELNIKVRERGSISDSVVRVLGISRSDGQLEVRVLAPGMNVYSLVTKR